MKWLLFVMVIAACDHSDNASHGAASVIATKPHAFPGFTLELPSGKERAEGDDYASGALNLSSATKPQYVISIRWQTGVVTPATLDQWQVSVASQLGSGATFSRVQHAGRDSIDVGVEDHYMVMTPLTCGKRLITVQTTAYEPAVQSLHDRIVKSLVCTPDPKRDY